MNEQDIQKYFNRIGYTGGRDVSFENLKDMQVRHMLSVPFENANTHMGLPIVVDDLEALKSKVLDNKRGGYCFELNQLFYNLLVALGYDCTPHVSPVRWEVPDDLMLGFTHLMILVKLDGKLWLVDVGAGPIGCPCPLDVHSEEPVDTPYSFHRIKKMDHDFEYEHQLLDAHGVWKGCYRFSTAFRSYVSDWVIGSYYTSTHPGSFFSYKLFLAVYTPNHERAVLFDTEFTLRKKEGLVERRVIEDRDEYYAMMRDIFLLPVDEMVNLKIPHAPWEAST